MNNAGAEAGVETGFGTMGLKNHYGSYSVRLDPGEVPIFAKGHPEIEIDNNGVVHVKNGGVVMMGKRAAFSADGFQFFLSGKQMLSIKTGNGRVLWERKSSPSTLVAAG